MRRRAVRSTSAALMAALVPGAGLAQSAGWEVFRTRCLAPMSEVAPPDGAGLVEGGRARFAAVMGGDMGAATYSAGEDLIFAVIPEGGGAFLGCMLLDESVRAEATYDAFAAWRDAELAAGRLRETESLLGQFYHSTTWREPKLRVGAMTGADPETGRRMLSLSVSDTDLES